MKKLVSLMLVLVLALSSTGALAVTVTDENFFQAEDRAYCYVKVTNDTESTISMDAVLEVMDADGNVIATRDFICAGCEELGPNQYTYISVYVDPKDAAAASHKLTLETEDSDETWVQFPANVTLVINEVIGWWVYNYANVEFTNTSDEMAVDPIVTVAFMDENGKILFVDDFGLYGLSVHPGSTVTARIDVSPSIVEYWEAQQIVPVKGDATVHMEK